MSQIPSFEHDSEEHLPVQSRVFDIAAKQDFENAIRKGYWRSVLSWFTRTDNKLLPYDEFRRSLPAYGQHEVGMRQIELDKIVGSVGRYLDFDRAFLPRRTNTRNRWESVDRAHLQDITLPPIEVYKVGSVFFVKDGNHRVSVARERGQAFIDAFVIELDVPIAVDENTNIEDMIRQAEQLQFEEKTRIHGIRPEAAIHFSVVGGSPKVLEHIDVHRWYMGEKRKAAVPYPEAVASWYDEVYLPLVRVIRHYRILEEFPGRTEDDLYLWIIEHLYYLRQEYQSDVSLEDAATHFAQAFRKRPFHWFVNFLRRVTRRAEQPQNNNLP
jgi:hypothetical protein